MSNFAYNLVCIQLIVLPYSTGVWLAIANHVAIDLYINVPQYNVIVHILYDDCTGVVALWSGLSFSL